MNAFEVMDKLMRERAFNEGLTGEERKFFEPSEDDHMYEAIPVSVPAVLSTDKATRKVQPVARGVLDYFPLALAEIANVSYVGNEQHNPGQPMHWARDKSMDHADCIVRHLMERGTIDEDGLRHSAKVAWRALALLQLELEAVRK